jgi:uncharacterized protein (TIGR03905 family)
MTIFDPLRKKEVALTPEERVRQWFIGVLSQQLEVPLHMMMSEAGFKLGGKQFRADILVYDRKAQPLAVVECKRPEVELTREVLDQAVRYNMVLNVQFIGGCNGNLQGISKLVDGMDVDEVIEKIEGIHCGFKPTSCPDQLAKALKEAKNAQ